MPASLTEDEFSRLQAQLSEDAIIKITYDNQTIDDQSRNPLTQTMRVTKTRDNLILGKRENNPRRNRGLALQNRIYGGERQTMLVGKNYVSGMRDNHTMGPVLDVEVTADQSDSEAKVETRTRAKDAANVVNALPDVQNANVSYRENSATGRSAYMLVANITTGEDTDSGRAVAVVEACGSDSAVLDTVGNRLTARFDIEERATVE